MMSVEEIQSLDCPTRTSHHGADYLPLQMGQRTYEKLRGIVNDAYCW